MTTAGVVVRGPLAQKATLDDLMQEVAALEQKHAAKNSARMIARRLQPLICFVERYSLAIDVAVQGFPEPATAIWALLRSVLVVAGTMSRYFDRLLFCLEQLGWTVSICSQYESLLGASDQFRATISLVYGDIMTFLKKAKICLSRSGFRFFFRSLWQDFDQEFGNCLAALSQHTDRFREESALLFRSSISQSVTINATSVLYLTDEQKREKLICWLQPDQSPKKSSAARTETLMHGGQWLLSSQEFQSWSQGHSSLIWIHGPAGTGKTVLSFKIIHHLQTFKQANDIVVHFHFYRFDSHDSTNLKMLSSLIVALIPPGRVPDHVLAAHDAAVKLGRRHVTQADSPEKILVALLGLHQRVYLVIDGLDEATRIPDVLDSLLSISQTSQNLALMAFSRDVPCINKRLSHAVHINLTPELTKPDIDKYIHDEIDKLEIPEMTPHIKVHATRFLQDRANGMFLWATLMVDSLSASTSEQDFTDTMTDVPTELTDLWLRGIHQLWQKPSKKRELARKTILWVCTAFLPLQWSELQCALALDLQAPHFFPERKPFLQVTLDLCSPFVSYDITSQTIRPVHPSFHDFIFDCEVQDTAHLPERAFFCSKPEAHRMLSLHCLTYLTQAYSAHGNLIEQPFTRYACLWWTKHFLAAEYCQELADAAEKFLSLHRRAWILHFLVWQKTTYPLHIIARYHTDLLNWSSHNSSMFNLTLDLASIIIDINKMCSHQRTTAFPYLDPLQQLAHSMTYFDNMMVARDLARILTQANQLAPGISLFESALADQSTYSGTPDAPDIVWLLNVLGLLYDQQSLTEKATSTQERALAIQSTHLGLTHPETVWTQNELGRMYRHQSRYAEAETMHLAALQTLRSLLPDPNQQSHSPEIAWTSSTLARVYRKQHNPTAALPHLTSALKTRTHLIGPTHPHSLWVLSDIAQCHYELGDFDFAERCHREAVAGRTEVLGLEHPDTLWSLNNLGVVLAAKAVATSAGDDVARDRWRAEAEEVQRRAYEAQKKVLGIEHPHTVWTRDALQKVLAPSRN